MGTYTTTFGFYKPDASEFVDPDTQLNRNWDIADAAVKRLLEYEYAAVQFPDMSQSPTNRANFYRHFSNSVVQWRKPTTWYQDPAARVHAAVHISGLMNEGYFEHPDFPLYYRVIKKSGGSTAEIEWYGAFYELGGAMELNVNATVISASVLPAETWPAVTKYFNVWAGNTSSDFSMARILIGNDGRMEFKRYGVNPSGGTSDENKIELTGIKYNVEVTG